MRTTKNFTLMAALAFIAMLFVQCSAKGNEAAQAATAPTATEAIADSAAPPVCNIKIAYVDYDSLLANYNFAQDVQKELIRREMSINNTIEKERKSLQEEAAAFEYKVQSGHQCKILSGSHRFI